MLTLLTMLSGAYILTAAEVPPQAAVNPIVIFLRAADVNDFAAMEAIMDRGGSNFISKVRNCYLRRVYQSPDGITAAWMCSEGPNRSRVVIGRVGLAAENRVSVAVELDDVNERPAPERAGSAFAD